MKDIETLRKPDLAALLSERSNLNRSQASDAINTIFDAMFEALSDEKRVAINRFGTFEVRYSKERTGVKPGTNDRITIPARKRVGFKPSSPLKNAVK